MTDQNRTSLTHRMGRRTLLAAIAAMSLLAASGCAARKKAESEIPVRAPTDVPAHFLVGDLSSEATQEPAPGTGCHNPMVDSRSGTRIKLVRSREGQGDYEVLEGKYGVGPGEVLRIDCATGRAIGIYKRAKG